jgi:hypothetical protein
MTVWSMRTVCDRCSFEYSRRMMRKEATGSVVCYRCFDGAFDLKKHPQNRPARAKRESLPVPDGRPPIDLTELLATEDGQAILTESGEAIEDPPDQWTPYQSVGY